MTSSTITKARTYLALGVRNLIRVGTYRVGLASGLHPVQRLRGEAPTGPFFSESSSRDASASTAHPALAELSLGFGWVNYAPSGDPPDWHANIVTHARVPAPERDWWHIPDFDPAVGDIKAVWEPSRFDWVVRGAAQVKSGSTAARIVMNQWLSDWCARNPPYRGPNWKCGQEASIRVMHLAMASLMLGETERPSMGMRDLLRLHLARVAPTVAYARGQDNNHGTSEAAALFIGGSWLLRAGESMGATWADSGRRLLEERVERLVASDGTFSQYSVAYHRMFLDTLSLAECWRRHLELPAWSPTLVERAIAATRWLVALVDPATGDAPNLGANDGAWLLPLAPAGHRDFRPSVQLAAALFLRQSAYPAVAVANDAVRALGVAPATELMPALGAALFDDGGIALLRDDATLVVLKYPRFRFRPGHADALHVDLWRNGVNLLRDGGTYSYSADRETLGYFSGTASHNTIQFDGRDQMCRVSRFLFSDWLRPNFVESPAQHASAQTVGASYTDANGVTHERRLSLRPGYLVVVDAVRGFRERAVLRWRLRPGAWVLAGDTVQDGRDRLTVRATVPIRRIALVDGWESRFYLQRSAVPVLEVEFAESGVVTTEYRWD